MPSAPRRLPASEPPYRARLCRQACPVFLLPEGGERLRAAKPLGAAKSTVQKSEDRLASVSNRRLNSTGRLKNDSVRIAAGKTRPRHPCLEPQAHPVPSDARLGLSHFC